MLAWRTLDLVSDGAVIGLYTVDGCESFEKPTFACLAIRVGSCGPRNLRILARRALSVGIARNFLTAS